MPKIDYCMFGPRQGIPSRDIVQEMPRQATVDFGTREGIPGHNRVLSWFCGAIGIPYIDMVLKF